jgi:hypothetical protein
VNGAAHLLLKTCREAAGGLAMGRNDHNNQQDKPPQPSASEGKEPLYDPVFNEHSYLEGLFSAGETMTGLHHAWSNAQPVPPWSPAVPAGIFTPPYPLGLEYDPFFNMGAIESHHISQICENLPMSKAAEPQDKKKQAQDAAGEKVAAEKSVNDFATPGEACINCPKVKRGPAFEQAATEALAPDIPAQVEPVKEAASNAAAAEYVSPSTPLEKTPSASAKAQRVKKARDDMDKGRDSRRASAPV